MIRGMRGGLVCILLATLASQTSGQTPSGFMYGPFWQRPLHIGLDVGSAIPTGDLGQAFNSAWNFGANVAWPFTPHGGGWLQADVNYASEGPKSAITESYAASTGVRQHHVRHAQRRSQQAELPRQLHAIRGLWRRRILALRRVRQCRGHRVLQHVRGALRHIRQRHGDT